MEKEMCASDRILRGRDNYLEFFMTDIMAVANQKGGVGKTTTCVNLAASLAATKHGVLLIDLDPQGNASVGSGVTKDHAVATSKEILLGEVAIQEAIIHTAGGYDLVAADGELTVAEIQLLKQEQREYSLKQQLQPVIANYDYVLIDCPPSLNILTVNALVCATSVLIPMPCEYFALEGLASLLQTIQQIRHSANPDLRIAGVLRTLYDGRNRLTQEVNAQLKAHFGAQLFTTVIPRNVRVAEAPSFGLPALMYDSRSPGAVAYLALAGELSRKQTKLSGVSHEIEA